MKTQKKYIFNPSSTSVTYKYKILSKKTSNLFSTPFDIDNLIFLLDFLQPSG